MRQFLIQYLVVAVIFFQAVTCSSTRTGSKGCKRRLDQVEPGRTCRKQCKSNKDCRGDKKRCMCDNVCGKSCYNKQAPCPDPGSLENGKISGNVFIYDGVIEYFCDRGFFLDGQSTRVCQSNRKWSGKKPKCVEGCSSPPRIGVSYSITHGNFFKVGTSVNYRCRFGYRLAGNSTSRCLKSFKWSSPKHSCAPVSCGNPGKPLNGYIEGEDFTFGKWITYRCNRGYIIDDARLVKQYCSTSGLWSGQPRTCSKLKCRPPTAPENGYIDRMSSSLEFRTTITYQCNPGYRIVGNSKGQCNEEGNWGILPNCSVEVDCNFDSAPPKSFCGYTNVRMAKWSRHLLHQNTVSGSPSYIIRAPGAPAVLRSPQIISKEPHCFKFFYFVKRIRNKMSVTIATTNGERTFGRVWPKEATFRWLSQQLTVNTIPNTGIIQYEIRINDGQTEVDMDQFTLEIGPCDTNCPAGTCLNGGICVDRIESFTCLCTPYYTGRNCETEILCPPLQTIAHGKITFRPSAALLKPETVARFSCDEGFNLTDGPHQVECTFDGVWSNPRSPVCKEILCPAVRSPSNGGRVMITEEKGKISIGSVVIFTCPINLYLSGGPEIRVCKKNGAWSYNSKPKCRQKKTSRRISGCPPGYLPINATCYRPFTSPLKFHDAASACAADDASLAIIRSREEREKVSKIMRRSSLYFYGATNAGFKDMRWLNKETFIRTAGEQYTRISKRQDITVNTRCGVMYKSTRSFTFSTRSCNTRAAFICQTFASKIQPITLEAQANPSISVDGLYRPMIGITHRGSPVYQRQTTPKIHLYRIATGWEVGAFDIKHTTPFRKQFVIRSNSSTSLPQDIKESWYKRTEETGIVMNVDLIIKIYDRWLAWSNWSTCSKTCGRGTRRRSRICDQEGATAGFGDCKGPSSKEKPCNTKKCIRTRWDQWSIWSNCTQPCGGGQTNRSRVCIRDPKGKEFCQGRRIQKKDCSTQECASETTKWRKLEYLKNEYKIFSLNETVSNPESFCYEMGGIIANASLAVNIDYLKTFFGEVHCKSASVFAEWILQLGERFRENIELDYSGMASGDKNNKSLSNEAKIDDAAEICRYMYHSCDQNTLSISEVECNDTLTSRILCERESLPCNSDPCGVGGRCQNINETHYECHCHSNFQGIHCEHEPRGCDLMISNLPVKDATFDQSYNQLNGEEYYLDKGEFIFINCLSEGIFEQFKCEGRNLWQPESVYEFCKS